MKSSERRFSLEASAASPAIPLTDHVQFRRGKNASLVQPQEFFRYSNTEDNGVIRIHGNFDSCIKQFADQMVRQAFNASEQNIGCWAYVESEAMICEETHHFGRIYRSDAVLNFI